MTLVISKGITLRKGWQPMDPDAAAYITAVETADGQALEEKTKIAIDNFVLGCKADGIWTAIKASCILAGARTLNGALVPLVGAAPTNVGGLFVGGDYNRETGLVGNASTKYLNTNRASNADPQNSTHLAVYQTSHQTRAGATKWAAGTFTAAASKGLATSSTVRFWAANDSVVTASLTESSGIAGLWGVNRNNSANVQMRYQSLSYTATKTSSAPTTNNIWIFARSGSSGPEASDARIAFYSLGESLDLALLDARVTDLINAFGAAIP
jgi:hypothetical protein